MLLDGSGVVLDLNENGTRLLGSTRDRVVGLPFRTWVVEEDRRAFLEHFRQCRSDRQTIESDARLRSRDGRVLLTRLYTKRAQYRGHTVFPTIAVDLTEQLELERARQTAERRRERAERDSQLARAADAAKDRLIATVSHELRNPLSPALLAASGLTEWPGLPPGAKHMAVVIKRNIEIEARLVDDLLDVARVSRGQLGLRFWVLDLHRVVREAVNACVAAAESAKVSIIADLEAERHHTNGDEARLRQVFGNLLNNAIKFSEAGGTVMVRSTNDADSGICISVRDQGAGMETEVLETLFSPFERPRVPRAGRSGLGLGLTIAKGIVEGHGGHIWASSEGLGQGSLFEIELSTVVVPSASDEKAPAEAVQESPEAAIQAPSRATGRRRVLVIEDHEDTSALMAGFLAANGFEVASVHTVAEGLAQLERSWDAILTDIGLADGSGLAICRRARALDQKMKIFVLSGYGTVADILASREAGCDEHLVKPVDLKRVLALLR